MASKSYRASKTGVKVFEDWRDNFIIDQDNPILHWKAGLPRERYRSGGVDGLTRLGSENSEDALTWNYFRTLQVTGQLLKSLVHQIPGCAGNTTDDCAALFWGRNPDAGEDVDSGLQSVLDRMEPWGKGGRKQQTEPDFLVLSHTAIIVVESKLGKPGSRLNAWNRKKPGIPKDYEAFVKTTGLTCFTSEWDYEQNGQRFYQLMRNWILVNALSRERSAKPYLCAVVNKETRNLDGRSHTEECETFKQFVPAGSRSSVVLLTWQDFYKDQLAHNDISESTASYASLKKWMEDHPLLRIASDR